MELYPDQYYHIYNRSNNNEIVFKEEENYLYFLEKYRQYFKDDLETIAYCLMPTHFHFLVLVKSQATELIKKNFGILLSSYTKAINKRHSRHGSLFQSHIRSRRVDDDGYLITLLTYIHQNPVRSGLVKKLEDWEFSSYRDYIGMRAGFLPKKNIIADCFSSVEDFKEFSETLLESVEKSYWV